MHIQKMQSMQYAKCILGILMGLIFIVIYQVNENNNNNSNANNNNLLLFSYY
eukprot:UN10929